MVSRVRRLDDLLILCPFPIGKIKYNDYVYTLFGCNSILPIENKIGWKELQAVVQAKSDINTKQRRDDH
jgi:hypothetical protein